MNTKTTAAIAAFIIAAFGCFTGLQAHELSARGYVGVGENVLIGGLIIEDKDCPLNGKYDENGKEQRDSVTFVIRALGPSLLAHGVANVLADPELLFYDANGNLIGGHSNYTEVDIPTQQAIYDHGLAPVDAKEVVFVVKLLPGVYTAILRGEDGGTGVALLEAYKL